jgi:hypothetical protein
MDQDHLLLLVACCLLLALFVNVNTAGSMVTRTCPLRQRSTSLPPWRPTTASRVYLVSGSTCLERGGRGVKG